MIAALIGVVVALIFNIFWLGVLRLIPFGLSLGLEAKMLVMTLQAVGAVGILLAGPLGALATRRLGSRFFRLGHYHEIALLAACLWGAILFIPDIGPLLKAYSGEYARTVALILASRILVDCIATFLFYRTLRRG